MELPKATNTSALSGAGVMRLFNKVGETVNKITYKMDESDTVSRKLFKHFWITQRIDRFSLWTSVVWGDNFKYRISRLSASRPTKCSRNIDESEKRIIQLHGEHSKIGRCTRARWARSFFRKSTSPIGWGIGKSRRGWEGPEQQRFISAGWNSAGLRGPHRCH